MLLEPIKLFEFEAPHSHRMDQPGVGTLLYISQLRSSLNRGHFRFPWKGGSHFTLAIFTSLRPLTTPQTGLLLAVNW